MRGLGMIFAAALVGTAAPALGADVQPICADRPSKSTGPCTVPQGKWQIETGLIDWSRDTSDGVRTDAVTWGNTAIKYGVSSRADIELWVTPLESVSIHGGGIDEHHSSFGDTLLRVKYAVTPDNAPVQVTLDPFVKVPTANHERDIEPFRGHRLQALLELRALGRSGRIRLVRFVDRLGHPAHAAECGDQRAAGGSGS